MKECIVSVDDMSNEVSGELAKILADEYVLSNKTRYAQWHIEGAEYYPIHKSFETQFGRLESFIKRIATRIGLFGHYVPLASPSFLMIAHINSTENNKKDCKEMLKELLTDHETIIKNLKAYILHFNEECYDKETADFIEELKNDHEQMAELLQKHL